MKHKKITAFSLVETLVTLAIFSILVAMLSDVLVLNIRVSRKITARTIIREELSQMVGLIQRDMRNANYIDLAKCGGDKDHPIDINNDQASKEVGCMLVHQDTVAWIWVPADSDNIEGCTRNNDFNNSQLIGTLCRFKVDASGWDVTFKNSAYLNIENVQVEKTFILPSVGEDQNQASQALLVFTIYAKASNPTWDINNQVRQIVVTTRNF
ncbi:MAG: prepilin-type N-terminal cleavage/methylation domain-containing protein [bacterium]